MDRKTPAVCQVVLLGVVLLLFDAAVCGANLTSYTTKSANRGYVMVMEEDGTNPVELFVGGKFSPFVLRGQILGHESQSRASLLLEILKGVKP